MFWNKYKKLIIGIIIIGVVLFLGRAIAGSDKTKNALVKKVSLTNRLVEKSVSASGSVTSQNEVNLAFTATQKITLVAVQKGDKVVKGQLLISLDESSYEQTVQASKDARDIALRQRELFVKNKDTNEDTLGGEKQYEIKLREYNETVSQADATYQSQAVALKSYTIYAPFTGTVLEITKKVGETATIGESVIKLADLTMLQFDISVDQEDFGSLKLGMKSEVSLDSYPNQTFSGTVSELPSYAEGTGTSTFEAKIYFTPDNSVTEKPLLGMTGDVKIAVASTQSEVPSLYYDEIQTDEDNKPFVWVVDNGYISKLPIEIGLEGDIYTEIKTKIDKQVVVPLTSDTEVKDGYKAKVVK